MGVAADDQARIDPDRAGTVAVVRLVVDEDRIRGFAPDRVESGQVDRGLRLPRADLERQDQRIELLLESEPGDDRSRVVRAVADERRLHTVRSERPDRGDRVVEQADAGRHELALDPDQFPNLFRIVSEAGGLQHRSGVVRFRRERADAPVRSRPVERAAERRRSHADVAGEEVTPQMPITRDERVVEVDQDGAGHAARIGPGRSRPGPMRRYSSSAASASASATAASVIASSASSSATASSTTASDASSWAASIRTAASVAFSTASSCSASAATASSIASSPAWSEASFISSSISDSSRWATDGPCEASWGSACEPATRGTMVRL